MSRLFDPPQAAQVEADLFGEPRQITWQGQHAVIRVLLRWRIDEGWWGQRRWREYFTLITRGGLLLTLYRVLDEGSWWILRLED